MDAYQLAMFEQTTAMMADVVPSFLRRFLSRCEEEQVPRSLSEQAAAMTLEAVLRRIDDDGDGDDHEILEAEPDEPNPRLFRD